MRNLKSLLFKVFFILATVTSIYFYYRKVSKDFVPVMSDEQKLGIYEKMFLALQKDNENHCSKSSGYCKRHETRHIDCGRVLDGDKEYISSITGKYRVPLIENPYINMSCSGISERIKSKYRMPPLKLGGISFARTIYQDYEFIENQVQTTWHPENRYCFVVDENTKESFKEKMTKLADCLKDQIVLVPAHLRLDSAGHNQNLAHIKCMEALLQFPNWGYLMLLQNHDIITKSVYELDRIFEIMGGANEVRAWKEVKSRRSDGQKWDPRSLKLFRNESEIPSEVLHRPLTISTGDVEASLSRKAVEWLIETVDLTIFIEQQNRTKYGVDEQFIPTFQLNSQLEMPGHFTTKCMDEDVNVAFITRIAQFANGDPNNCASRTVRHDACLFGIENLRAMSELSYLSWNKVYPSFDWSIIDCTAELLFNKTFLGQAEPKLDEDYYMNLVTVQYHKNHKNPGFELNCTSGQNDKRYEDYLRFFVNNVA